MGTDFVEWCVEVVEVKVLEVVFFSHDLAVDLVELHGTIGGVGSGNGVGVHPT